MLKQPEQNGIRSSKRGQRQTQQPCTSAGSGLMPMTVWGSCGRGNGLTCLTRKGIARRSSVQGTILNISVGTPQWDLRHVQQDSIHGECDTVLHSGTGLLASCSVGYGTEEHRSEQVTFAVLLILCCVHIEIAEDV
jgi:hypothetical protein